MATSNEIFRDPIHGSIELDPVLVKIIDTPEFQRLRRIKQLGVNHLVYPGAVHTRFAHSIGVCHIAGELITALQAKHAKDNKENNLHIEITPKDVMSVKVAALCHDLGHGPFSHLYDSLVKKIYKKNGERKTADDKEEKCDPLAKREDLREIFDKIYDSIRKDMENIDDIDKTLVKKLIVYSEEYDLLKNLAEEEWKKWTGVTKDKCYLFEIVANGITGIDVDKMDYFERDSHGLGLSSRFDWRRYIQTAKIMKVPKLPMEEQRADGKMEEPLAKNTSDAGKSHHNVSVDEDDKGNEDDCLNGVKNDPLPYHICSRDKEVHNLYELFHMREQLHRTAYQHKTVIAAELMMTDILTKGDDHDIIQCQFQGKNRKYKITECWQDMDAFVQLDDSIIDILWAKIQGNVKDELYKLLEQFQSRKINYKHIMTFTERHIKIFEEKHQTLDKVVSQHMNGMNYRLVEKKFNYGKKEKDPLDYHYFYGKDDKEPWLMKHTKPVMIPQQFQEEVIIVYCKDLTIDQLTKARSDLKTCVTSMAPISPPPDPPSDAMVTKSSQ